MRRLLEAALVAALTIHAQSVLAQSDATETPAQQAPAAASQGAGDGAGADQAATQPSAQPRNGGASQQTLEERIRRVGGIPGGVVDAAINGKGREAYRIIGNFLADGNAVPGTRVARSVAIIRRAATDSRVEGQRSMGPVIDRVSVVAQRAVNSPLIFETAVERDFVPPPNTVAFDLGAPDSTVAVGFERVDPDGGVLSGKGLKAQSRLGGGALLSDGISGVEGFTAQVPNGTYRVVLLADTPPEGRIPRAPFGTMIESANDTFYLGKARPAQWLSRAWIANPVLSEPALREIYRSLPGHQILAEDPLRGSGGYGYGIAFKTEVTGGFIDVRLETPEDSEPIYVSAIMVQPADQKAVWLTERNIVTNALAHRFLQVMDAGGDVSPRRAAAIVAYAVHQRPDRASEIFGAGLGLFPDAIGQIAQAVAGLDAVEREQVVAWISEDSGLTQAQKRKALGELGRTQEVQRSTQ